MEPIRSAERTSILWASLRFFTAVTWGSVGDLDDQAPRRFGIHAAVVPWAETLNRPISSWSVLLIWSSCSAAVWTLLADALVDREASLTPWMSEEIPRAAFAASPTLRETSVAPRAASATVRDLSPAAPATSAIDRAMSPTPLLASPTFCEIIVAARVCFSTDVEILPEEA